VRDPRRQPLPGDFFRFARADWTLRSIRQVYEYNKSDEHDTYPSGLVLEFAVEKLVGYGTWENTADKRLDYRAFLRKAKTAKAWECRWMERS
jgi:hypothetical protein